MFGLEDELQAQIEKLEDSIEERLNRLEAILRQAKMHEPRCPADHDCARDHPTMAIACVKQPCRCWLSDGT